MMFNETQVFEGLTAWFSTSVPASLKSLWGRSHCMFMSDMQGKLAGFSIFYLCLLGSSEEWGTSQERVQ